MDTNTASNPGYLGHRRVLMRVPQLPFQVNEAINILRGNIQLSGYDIKVVGVTSAMKHEGKSSLSFRLAQSFAALGKKTIYVDCDIRNSKTMSRYRVRRKCEGLSEYLCGTAPLDQIIFEVEQSYLDVIFTGAMAPNPSELFSGELFNNMLQRLRHEYDYVIVDTPPINAVIDGALIAKQCDGVVLVVESGVTERGQVQHMKQQLEFTGVKLLGVALNKIGTRKSGYGYGYGYGQGYGYGYGYGYGEKKKKKKLFFKRKSDDNDEEEQFVLPEDDSADQKAAGNDQDEV